MDEPPVYRGITSIQITRETKARLAQLGEKGDTYEDIIKRFLNSPRPKKG